MRRVTWTPVVLALALTVAWAGLASAGSIQNLRMSDAPDGPAWVNFPSGTSRVYVVFDYAGMQGETIRVRVSDSSGAVFFDKTNTYSGFGTVSIPVSPRLSVFDDGPYVTIVYFAGGYLSQSTEWTVGGATAPPTPTPLPPPSLRVVPSLVTFSLTQGEPAPAPRSILVTTSTDALVVWRATASASWLQVRPIFGGTPALLRVTVDPAGLPADRYSGLITVSSDTPGVRNTPQQAAVVLDIARLAGTETASVLPQKANVGWVSSADGNGNHLGAPDIRVGMLDGAVHYGLVQFDLTYLATDTQVSAATISFTGRSREFMDTDDTWRLQLLAPDIDDTWATLTYTDVNQAGILADIPPALGITDLNSGRTNFFIFDPDQLGLAQARMGSKLSLRLVGPTSGADNLFVWDSGYDELGAGVKPVLRINYYTPPSGPPAPTPTPEGVAGKAR
jgi:hypothetical protein